MDPTHSTHPLASSQPLLSTKRQSSPFTHDPYKIREEEEEQESDKNDNGDDNNPEDGPDIAVDDPDGIQKPELIEIPAWKKFLLSKWGAAVLISTVTIILLLFIRPAFILRRRENILDKPRINWLIVFITWIVLFIALVTIPLLITFCRKKWVGKKS